MGRSQEQAAAKANLSWRGTIAKYERLGKLPSEMKEPRTYRTRKDPFEVDWPMIVEMLCEAPGLQAKALFVWLCGQRLGCYQEGQLRTFQRRVSVWKAKHVGQLLTLEQVRRPGELMQTDGTCMNKLGVTIRGVQFDHMLIHSVLPYSNWEWGRVTQTESFLAIKLALQSAVQRLGHVPSVHQTDNTSAATHDLNAGEGTKAESGRHYNGEYLALLGYYGMEPRTTHLGAPNENGDIEAMQGSLKREVEQRLLLRGSRDFASIEEYEQFLFEIMDQRNALRDERLQQELAVMTPVTVDPLPEMKELRTRVSKGGTIRVLKNTYSVPSGLKGRRVTIRVFEWYVEVWYSGTCIETIPRLKGQYRTRINYRHVIDTLLRKPGGFRDYRHRDDLFPSAVFREVWEALSERLSPRRADLSYLRILKLAAVTMESDVELALRMVLDSGEPWDEGLIESLVKPEPEPVPLIECGEVDLASYDRLLTLEVAHDPA
jgi:transposase InsO family protein